MVSEMRAARPVFYRIIGCMLAATGCAQMCAHAQADLYSLEAAYIYNFTEFTEWPAAPAGGTALTVCVGGRSPLGAALAKLDGRAVSGRTWSVKPMPDGSALTACNVLIVDDAASNAAAKAASARDLPMLVVRVPDADADDGRYVVTMFREGDRLRFDIDNTEAVHRHLGLSSKLLRLARNVT
jgi:hypothetical protein